MRSYKIIVQGLFLNVTGMDRACVGIYSTFFISAISASSAVERIRGALYERLRNENIDQVKSGIFKTYFIVHGIWEIEENAVPDASRNVGGASLFKIGRLEKIYYAIKRIILNKTKPWILIGK